MKNGFLKSVSILFLALLATRAADAKFYIEPMLSYQQGYQDFEYDVTIPVLGGEGSRSSINGWGLGLGMGWKFSSKINVGADLQTHFLNVGSHEYNSNSTKTTQYTATFIVGYDLSAKFNIYLGGGSMQSHNDTDPRSIDYADAGKIGLSYAEKEKYVGFVELLTFTMKSNTTNGISTRYDEVYDEYIYNVLSVGVKVPFSF